MNVVIYWFWNYSWMCVFGVLVISNVEEINTFANWLLDIGEGNVGGLNDGETIIDILDDLLITHSFDPIGSLVEFVYPSIVQTAKESQFLPRKSNLDPKE